VQNYFYAMAFTVTYITVMRCELYVWNALIYLHTDAKTRAAFFPELINSTKTGGFLIMEVLTKKQLQNTSGGPKSEDYLYDISMIKEAFNVFEFMCEEVIIELDEGNFYKGRADIIRVIARKK